MLTRAAFLSLAVLAILGCKTNYGRPDEYGWKLTILTPTISRGADFLFRVDTNRDGADVPGVHYSYVVDWVNNQGMNHKGTSGEQMKIRAKGNVGRGEIRILATKADGTLIEVARGNFETQ